MSLSIKIPSLSLSPSTRSSSSSWDEISTPMAPRARSASVATPVVTPVVTPLHRNTYLAEYCYECENEFNFLRTDEYVVIDRVFCSRRCFNRFQNTLCDVCERHPCACQDDISTISDASATSVDDEDDFPDFITRDDQLPVNLAFIEHSGDENGDTADRESDCEIDYEDYDEDDEDDPNQLVCF